MSVTIEDRVGMWREAVQRETGLSTDAKRVAGMLANFVAGGGWGDGFECEASLREISIETRMRRENVSNALGELHGAGWVKTIKSGAINGTSTRVLTVPR